MPYGRDKHNKHHGKHLNQNSWLDDINVAQTQQWEDQVHNVWLQTNAKICRLITPQLWHNPHSTKQFDHIPRWAPRLLSHLWRTCKTKVQGSNAEPHKDQGNKTQPHCSSLPYPGADALHLPPGLCKCTIVWNDQEVKIKIPKNPEHVCQTGSKQA